MAKYSFEFKKKVVLEYINGEGGTQYLSTKYGLGSNSQIVSRFFRKFNFCRQVAGS